MVDISPERLQGHINWANLHKLSEGNLDFELELLKIFVEDSTNYLKLLDIASARNDSKQIEQIAHHIKGASANLGAIEIMEAAAQLEISAKRDIQRQEYNFLIKKLTLSLNEIRNFLIEREP